MKFICSIIVVEDIARSRKLYEHLLGQKVIAEFGDNDVAFEGGLALYKRSLYQSLIGPDPVISNRTNNFELYFEEDNLAEFEKAIAENGFSFIHRTREEPWQQRVFRFYDYDDNIVVIAESIAQVSSRLFREGNTIEAISSLTGEPVEQVGREVNGRG